MKNTSEPAHYISFLLRLWQTQDRGRIIWRASLESPGSGEKRGFANIEELIAFLRHQIENPEIEFPNRPAAIKDHTESTE